MDIQEAMDTYLASVRCNPHCRAALNGLRDYVSSHHLDWLSLTLDQCKDVMSIYRSSNEIIMKRYKGELYRFYFWVSQQGHPSAGEIAGFFHKKDFLAVGDYFDSSCYFESYPSMVDAVESAANTGKYDEFSFVGLVKSLLTLAWFGMSKKEALTVRKDEVVFEDGLVHVGRLTIRNPRAVEILRNYYDEDGMYRTDGKFYSYNPSPFFFRSTVGTTISDQALVSYFAKINAAMKPTGKSISYNKVYDSAKYLMIYTAYQKSGLRITATPRERDRQSLIKLLELPPESGSQKFLVAYRAFYGWYKHFKEDK